MSGDTDEAAVTAKCEFLVRGDYNDCAHAGGGRGAPLYDWCKPCLLARLRDTEQGDGKERETPAGAGDVGTAAWLAHVREILERIKAQQPATLAVIESNGFVFTDIGREPGNWMHLAFSIYTDLCEVDTLAEHALEALDEAVESRDGTSRTAEPSVQELEARVEHLTTALRPLVAAFDFYVGTTDNEYRATVVVSGEQLRALRVAAGAADGQIQEAPILGASGAATQVQTP